MPPFKVVLRQATLSDLPTLFAFESNPTWCAVALVKPRTEAAFNAAWSKIFADWEAGSTGVIENIIVADGEVCGTIGCLLLDGRQVVGYGLGQAYWCRGIASRALGLLLDELPMRPLHETAAAANIASIRVLRKHGFIIAETRSSPETERCLPREEVSLILP